jgi:hypothetical protein
MSIVSTETAGDIGDSASSDGQAHLLNITCYADLFLKSPISIVKSTFSRHSPRSDTNVPVAQYRYLQHCTHWSHSLAG